MAKAPAAGKARTKSNDTPESEKSGGPAIRPAPTDEAPDARDGDARSELLAAVAAVPGDALLSPQGATLETATDPAPSDPGEEQECLVVTGPARGRRRCGVRFGPEPEVIPLAWLRPDEVEAIEADPELTVVRELRVVRPR
jgi:hypothetical protein